MIKVWRLL